MINSAAFSPDGQRVATASDDHTARLWDATTGRILLTLKGHLGEVRSVAISSDGRRIATCGFDYTAKIWRAAAPEQVAEWQDEH